MIVSPFSHLFEYKDGKLYWRSGKRLGLEAGCVEKDGYMRVSVKNRKYYVHVIIFSMFIGRLPRGIIDHINGKRSDNRIENLVECNTRINSCNRICHRNGKLPGVKTTGNRFCARIRINGKEKYLGSFDSEIAAYIAYNEKLEEIGGRNVIS